MRIYDEFKSSFITIAFLMYIFFISGLIINFLQLCSCLIWPFNKELYRKINCYLALGIWSRKSSSSSYLQEIFFYSRIYIRGSMVVEK
jgi:hypothetical protein